MFQPHRLPSLLPRPGVQSAWGTQRIPMPNAREVVGNSQSCWVRIMEWGPMMAQWGQILAGRDQPNPKKSAKLILSRSSKTPRPKIESQNDHSLKQPNKQRTKPWNVNELSMTCTTGQLEGLNGKISLCFGIGMGPAIMMTPAFTKRSLLTHGQWWPSNSDNPAFVPLP